MNPAVAHSRSRHHQDCCSGGALLVRGRVSRSRTSVSRTRYQACSHLACFGAGLLWVCWLRWQAPLWVCWLRWLENLLAGNQVSGVLSPGDVEARVHLVPVRHAERVDDGVRVALLRRALVVAAAVDHHVAGGASHLQRHRHGVCACVTVHPSHNSHHRHGVCALVTAHPTQNLHLMPLSEADDHGLLPTLEISLPVCWTV